MLLGLDTFSRFLSEMHERQREDDAEGVARWAVSELSRTIGFDCAWYGWARFSLNGVEMHANASINLPDSYYESWKEISDQDLLALRLAQRPGVTATYERHQQDQTDGMVSLADTYGLNKMATAVHSRPGRSASFYLSGYRVGRISRSWSTPEREFLQCAVDQISESMKLTTNDGLSPDSNDAVSIYVSDNGIGILGLGLLREHLGSFWPDWSGDLLPEQLRSLVNQPGQHILPDRNLVVTSEDAPEHVGMGLRKLKLRKMNKFDRLTNRERQVAMALAAGMSHKEAARHLGVAPVTVRNQTQAVYAKLEVDNRANLTEMVHKCKATS